MFRKSGKILGKYGKIELNERERERKTIIYSCLFLMGNYFLSLDLLTFIVCLLGRF